jgi:hypothetical protein
MTTSKRPSNEAAQWGQAPVPPVAAPMEQEGRLPELVRGAVTVLRQFDLADEVDLAGAQRLVGAERLHVRPRTTALVLPKPPLAVALGTRTVRLAGREWPAEVVARVFDFGAVSVRLRIALGEGASWQEASALVRAAQADEELTRLAREETDRLATRIAPALSGRHAIDIFEDYVVLSVDGMSPSGDGTSLPLRDVARLLLGEAPGARLSDAEVLEATRHRSSYDGSDLCVAGWSTALVVEPAGDPDVLEVLELANAQLLELRSYDELLDRALDELYGEVATRRGARRGPFRNYAPVLHRTMAVMLEIAEFVERVENAIKVIGDTYLARLYGAAVESLRIPAWERSVTRKQALLQQVYDVLKNEVDASRGLLVEVLVVVLILMEIVMAAFRH